jgi:hypothetical protein
MKPGTDYLRGSPYAQMTLQEARTGLENALKAGESQYVDLFTNIVRMKTGQEYYTPDMLKPAFEEPTAPGARRLAGQMTHSVSPQKRPLNEDPASAHFRHGANSLLFGLQDEIAGAAGATINAVTDATPGGWGETYEGIRDQQRDAQARYGENFPVVNALGHVVGPVVPLRAAARGVNALTETYGPLRVAPATGATVGGAQSFGLAEGPAKDQAWQTIAGAGTGLVGGGTASTATIPLTKAGEFAGRVATRGLSVDERVRALLREQQTRANTNTAEQVARLREAQGDANVVQYGNYPGIPPGYLPENQPLTKGVLTPAGLTGDTGDAVLQQARRQTAELQEAIETVARYQGAGTNLREELADLSTQQRMNAGRLYEKAYANPVNPRSVPEIAEQLNDPVILRALREGMDLLQWEGKRPRKLLERTGVDDNGEPIFRLVDNPTWEELDLVQRGMRQMAEKLRIEQPSKARLINERRRQFLAAIDGQNANPTLREARSMYAGYEALKEAMERGRRIFSNAKGDWDIEDIVPEFQAYTPSERQAYLTGVAKALRETVERARVQTNNAGQPQFSTPENINRLETVLGRDAAEFLLSEVNRTGANVAAARRVTTTSGTPESMYATTAFDSVPKDANILSFLRTLGQNTGLAQDTPALQRMSQVLLEMDPQQYATFMRGNPFSIGPAARRLWSGFSIEPNQPVSGLWDGVRTPGATSALGATGLLEYLDVGRGPQ